MQNESAKQNIKAKTLEEKIAVMQHYANGGKVICNGLLTYTRNVFGDLIWNWEVNDFAIYEEPKTKPSINWEHVHKDFKYLATDANGETFMYKVNPRLSESRWIDMATNPIVSVKGFSSFLPGTCDWKDSLVKRPE